MINIFDVSIFIVTNDKDIIEVHEFENTMRPQDGCFVMITNDWLNPDYDDDNTIFIYRDWARFECMGQWQIEKKGIPNVLKVSDDYCIKRGIKLSDNASFFNGYDQTINIMNNAGILLDSYNKDYSKDLKLKNYIPVVANCFDRTISFNNKDYHGYLPAIGQIGVIGLCVSQINHALRAIHSELFDTRFVDPFYLSRRYWSSLEYDNDTIWSFDVELTNRSKTTEQYAFPLFKVDI